MPQSDERTFEMKRAHSSVVAMVVIAVVLCGAAPAFAQIPLGTAQNFAVLGGSTVPNTGPSAINGNLGVSPGSSVTGFPPGPVTGGSIHAADAVAAQAQSDLTTAYNTAAGTPCGVDLTGQNLGGLVLTPGVYCFTPPTPWPHRRSPISPPRTTPPPALRAASTSRGKTSVASS